MTSHRDDEWTEHEIKILRNLWPKDSARIIGIVLKKSRSAILGKAHRLGLERKTIKNYVNHSPKKTQAPKKRGRPPKPTETGARALSITEVINLPDEPITDALNISILQLTEDTCHYPTMCDTYGVPTAYCGKPAKIRAYCIHHARLCYQPNIPPIRRAKRR